MAAADWIGSFVSLGSLLRRYSRQVDNRQLVVTVSVPRRDYVATLIGAGWMLSAPAPDLGEPIDVFRAADRQTCLRAVTERKIVTGTFSSLDESRTPPRVTTGGKVLRLDAYKAVAVLDGICETVDGNVPDPGYLGDLTGAAKSWLSRIAAPPQELALVGTVKWLREDLEALIGNGLKNDGVGTPLANYVLPVDDRAATLATAVIPAARLAEGGGIPPHCAIAILDRYGAIKYLNDITTPMVVCIVDRSIIDDSAAEIAVQARIGNSRAVSLKDDIRWQPPAGVEALAFTVAL
ncbi:hypothetical protein GS503_21670 [Rhodococcus hoagii]|nr:hypothetical protein [Prescottella equi]NKR71632.1 hypothetical protein [Prescottella equi]